MTQPTETIDLLIEARWIAPVETPELLTNHSVAVNQGRIVAVLPTAQARSRFNARETCQLSQHILIPGLINLHTHAAMSLLRGIADDLPLMTWLQKHIWPAEAALVSPAFVLDGTRLACAEMLLGGTTCFNDMYFYPEAAAQAASEFGMRASLGITTLEFPTNYANDADDYLSKGLAAREACSGQDLIQFTLAPHAPYTVSNKTFERILTLSEQLHLPIHCHLHETRQEIRDGQQQHGMPPIERLQSLGLITPGFIGVHAVHLSSNEITTLAAHGSHIAHCPSSNLKLGSGMAPTPALQQAGINIGLGTDGAASNNRLDMFWEMRLAALLAKGLAEDPEQFNTQQTLRMATLNGAKALGIDHITGSISSGKSADLCAVSLADLQCQPCFDPLSHLIYVAGREHVTHVWVAGKCQVRERILQNPAFPDLERQVALWQNKTAVCSTIAKQ